MAGIRRTLRGLLNPQPECSAYRMTTATKYDVFVSHNRREKPWVRQFVRHLRSAGLKVFFDEDSIAPGEDVVRALENAVESSRHVAIVLSSASVCSKWVALETAMTLYGDPDASGNILIPILIDPVELSTIRPAVRRLNLVDLTDGVTRDFNYRRLLVYLGVPETTVAETGLPEWSQEAPERHHRSDCIIHDLPPAPRFVGRLQEAQKIDDFWNSPAAGVLCLVGIGGAGKTAIVAEFLSRVSNTDTRPSHLLVWSFYDDTDCEAMLSTAYEYFAGETRKEVKGAGWLHLLRETLAVLPRPLLVLDGLERIQRIEHRRIHDRHRFGELEDTLLRDLLKRIASGAGRCKAIITTRFPLVDLERWSAQGFIQLDLDQLDEGSAVELLARHGVKGTADSHRRLTEVYGRHALTLDHLGSLLVRYFDGDPSRAPTLGSLEHRGRDAQARRLSSIFRAYEEQLPPDELAVLSRLCVFRSGITADLFVSVFVRTGGADREVYLTGQAEIDVRETLDSLVLQHLVIRDGRQVYTVHPAVRDHFYTTFTQPAHLHEAIGQHLASLTARPGSQYPSDKSTLDHLEELLFHMAAAGLTDQAARMYHERIGGVWHLARIGEFARGLRMLSHLPENTDCDGLLRYRRGVGDIPSQEEWQRYREHLTFYSANAEMNTCLLRGRLKGADSSTARFLMGEAVSPHFSDDYAPRFSAILLLKAASAFANEDKSDEDHEEAEDDILPGEDAIGAANPRFFRIPPWRMPWMLLSWRLRIMLHTPLRFGSALVGRLLGFVLSAIVADSGVVRTDARLSFLYLRTSSRFDSIWGEARQVLRRRRASLFPEIDDNETVSTPSLSADLGNEAIATLWDAEIARLRGDIAKALSLLEEATRWVLSAESPEHLCILHLVRSRVFADMGKWPAALLAATEGIDVALTCGFRILHVDLLIAKARILMKTESPSKAKTVSEEALALADHPDGCYVWGRVMARARLLEALGAVDVACDSAVNEQSLLKELAELPDVNCVLGLLGSDFQTWYADRVEQSPLAYPEGRAGAPSGSAEA